MKKLLVFILLLLTMSLPFNVLSENDRVVDMALMLSESDRSELTEELDYISSKYDLDVVVYFSTDTSFGDDENAVMIEGGEFFDNNGYGYGDDHRGILLIVNYATGCFDIITTGSDVMQKYDGYIEEAYEYIIPYLRDNPAEAVRTFIEWVDTRFIYEEDYPIYDGGDDDIIVVEEDNTVKYLVSSGVISAIISSIVMFVLKKQLKTEGKKHNARNYIVPNSFNLTRSGDLFLYRTTTRRRIERNNNNNNHSSSGGGHHVSFSSSSGISHGSGGGHRF